MIDYEEIIKIFPLQKYFVRKKNYFNEEYDWELMNPINDKRVLILSEKNYKLKQLFYKHKERKNCLYLYGIENSFTIAIKESLIKQRLRQITINNLLND